MRTLSLAEQAALSASTVPWVVLVELHLSQTLYLCSAGIDLDVGGITYMGTRGLGRIDTVADSPAEIKPLSFELSGVPSTAVATVLTERVRGRLIRVLSLLLDPETGRPLTPRLRWQGRGDVMALREQGGMATISVTAEHVAADLLRGRPSYWSDAEQRRLYPGDPSLQYMAPQVEQRIVWPSKEFFRR